MPPLSIDSRPIATSSSYLITYAKEQEPTEIKIKKYRRFTTRVETKKKQQRHKGIFFYDFTVVVVCFRS